MRAVNTNPQPSHHACVTGQRAVDCSQRTMIKFPAMRQRTYAMRLSVFADILWSSKLQSKKFKPPHYQDNAALAEPITLRTRHLHKCHILLVGPNGGRVPNAISRRRKKRPIGRNSDATHSDMQGMPDPWLRMSVYFARGDSDVSTIGTQTSHGWVIGGLRLTVSGKYISAMVKVKKRQLTCPFDKRARLQRDQQLDKCSYLGAGFANMSAVKRHIRYKHPAAGVWTCENCKLVFCKKSNHVAGQIGCSRRGFQKGGGQDTLWKHLYKELFGDSEAPNPYISTCSESPATVLNTSGASNPPASDSPAESTSVMSPIGQIPVQASTVDDEQKLKSDLLGTIKQLTNQLGPKSHLDDHEKHCIQQALPILKALLTEPGESSETNRNHHLGHHLNNPGEMNIISVHGLANANIGSTNVANSDSTIPESTNLNLGTIPHDTAPWQSEQHTEMTYTNHTLEPNLSDATDTPGLVYSGYTSTMTMDHYIQPNAFDYYGAPVNPTTLDNPQDPDWFWEFHQTLNLQTTKEEQSHESILRQPETGLTDSTQSRFEIEGDMDLGCRSPERASYAMLE